MIALRVLSSKQKWEFFAFEVRRTLGERTQPILNSREAWARTFNRNEFGSCLGQVRETEVPYW